MKKIQNTTNKLVTNLKSLKAEAYCTAAAIAVGAYNPLVGTVYADEASSIIQKICDIVATRIFPLVGGVIALIGVFKLIMAIRNDQPEAQASAARDIVIGAVMVAFALIFWNPISNILFK